MTRSATGWAEGGEIMTEAIVVAIISLLGTLFGTWGGLLVVLCGIAQPHYLMEHVRQQYNQAQLMAFPDHHAFTAEEIDQIILKAKHFDFVLTTEKDLERLRATDLEQRLAEQGKPLVVLPIRMRFLSPKESFDRFILTYVGENIRKNHKS